MIANSITQKQLKELLKYDPLTGVFIWSVASSNRFKVGDVAGTLRSDGYINIGVKGKYYKAHRLAFMYMTGGIPKQVDHDNHIRNDNRWKNLNSATNAINSRNQSMPSNNTSNCIGVCFREDIRKWQSYITIGGNRIHIGYFTNKIDAIQARKTAEVKYNFHKNHGK